ncbi:conserved hypothetical protein [Altererythrobacter sp. B11]|uniref:translocation/assembly module TamB domain-containing protein n=1 Tax=Altererythrobacter sp. B11 TaxID=2060312 RepID=UPI000DC7233B|nr:translocation/assembly module TamB domain-containing protein [Altererythrobacter sp. B11]BBC74146.1 conserved hypothetical protein [Altererythrobacter sp. B11]
MADEIPPAAEAEAEGEGGATRPRRSRAWPIRLLRWIGTALFGLLLLLAVGIGWLHTGWGRQFIVDEISRFAPASGLSVEVGHIEGSVLWSASFYDVKLRDSKGVLFLEVPEVDLNWRPWKFPFTGLDVRHLVLRQGQLHAAPKLVPGDPDAPILPDFNIRVDRLVIDRLHVDEQVLGQARTVDFNASANIRRGRVDIRAEGDLGGGDELKAVVLAEPDGDRFDLDVDYRAPAGGLLATLTGMEKDLRVRLQGDGSWERWNGGLLVQEAGSRLASMTLANRAGTYTISGLVWPAEHVSGTAARALGRQVAVGAVGTLERSVLAGAIVLRGSGLRATAEGGVNLADNAFDDLRLRLALLDPRVLGGGIALRDAELTASLAGPFRNLSVPHRLRIGQLDLDGVVLRGLTQSGTLTRRGAAFVLPLDVAAQRVVTGQGLLDPRLVNGRLRGTLLLEGGKLRGDRLALAFEGLAATLSLDADPARGTYRLAGPVRARGLPLQGVGVMNADATIRASFGGGTPWRLTADVKGSLPRITNGTITTIAGEDIRFAGGVTLGERAPVVFRDARLTGSKLTLSLDGRIAGGRTTLVGSGRQEDYGAFTVEGTLEADGPHAELVFAAPLPAAGLRDVRLAISPAEQGLAIETEGQSTLGPFTGSLLFVAPEGGPSRISVNRFVVSDTTLGGDLTFVNGGVRGMLTVSGGGLDGTIGLMPQPAGQAVHASITARNASFSGATALSIRQADIELSGLFREGGNTISGQVTGAGIGYGTVFLGRLAAKAQVTDGTGSFDAAMSGQRGSDFELQLTGEIAPERLTLAARGSYGGEDISMPRRAVLLKAEDGGWQLQPTQVGYDGGFVIAEGRFGGAQPISGKLQLASLPLSVADAAGAELGLGGSVSGIVEVGQAPSGAPTGTARLMVNGLTRSGLVLSSRPVDLALVADLRAKDLQARAVVKDASTTYGRLQARISGLPADGALFDRLYNGDLFAQLRFSGPADSLWRLLAIELIDINGTLKVAADVRGTVGNPQVRGSLAGDGLRLQSALTGTDVRNVSARGSFAGSRLQLTSFAGTAQNGGKLSGSGFIDLSNMRRGRGPQIDIRIAARDAEVLDLPGMGATVTGPLRIVSSGFGGTIAGRLRVSEARWRLGGAVEAEQLPDIRTREINLPADIAPPSRRGPPWRFLIDAHAPGGVAVDGLGLDSEWSGDVRLRGTTEDPRVGGSAKVVPRQGFYSFAGVRFDITRGDISFDENVPIDPRIDILAETDVNDLSVQVTVSGNATRPAITFSSTPALPEEELLARLLYGGSITTLSATEAIQLGAAVASLQGGGGMDPINRLRSAVGLDRLRIVPADPALDRATAVALGKNFGRRFYVEIVTDGRGYNATSFEFRLTSWLSLLANINSLGRGGASVEYSRDY